MQFNQVNQNQGSVNTQIEGLTLRDYFAAKAIPEIVLLSQHEDGGWDPVAVAAGCYAVADAMLAERKAAP